MADFLLRWKLRDVGREHSRRLWYAAHDQFEHVAEGDTVWICTSKRPSRLIVLGPIRVDRVCDLDEANGHLKPHGQHALRGRSHHILTLPRAEAVRQRRERERLEREVDRIAGAGTSSGDEVLAMLETPKNAR